MIKNRGDLAVSPARRDALDILEGGLFAIDTRQAIRGAVRVEGDALIVHGERLPLGAEGRLVAVAIGKCAFEAASALEEIVGDRLSRGVALGIGTAPQFRTIEAYEGTHPLPSDANMRGAQAIADALRGLDEKDTVLVAVSGGGSTLLCLPEADTCEAEIEIFQALTARGATIEELNTVRKHLSRARGGFLAEYAYPAQVIGLIFSDVPSNNIGFIASGPTVMDTTTVKDAATVLEKHGVPVPSGLIETPKDENYFKKVHNVIAVSNMTALRAMQAKAGELGYEAKIMTGQLSGEAKETAASISADLAGASTRTVLLYGGETTVTLGASVGGKGGRNMELALAGLQYIGEGELIISAASDGRDNTEFAGAICDILTGKSARERGLDATQYLKEHRSYDFFKAAGHYLVTGPLGSNVSDLIIAIKE